MYHIKKNTKIYYLVGTIVGLMAFAMYFQVAKDQMEYNLLREKSEAITWTINCICDTMDYLVDRRQDWSSGD